MFGFVLMTAERQWIRAGMKPARCWIQQGVVKEHRVNPSPRHLLGGWGLAKADLGCGPAGRPGELEAGPAVVSLGQGLMFLGGDMGSWSIDRVGGALRETMQRQAGPLVALTCLGSS